MILVKVALTSVKSGLGYVMCKTGCVSRQNVQITPWGGGILTTELHTIHVGVINRHVSKGWKHQT